MKKIISIIGGIGIIMIALVLAAPQAKGGTMQDCQNAGKLAVCPDNTICTVSTSNWECKLQTDKAAEGFVNKITATDVKTVGNFQTIVQSIVGWIQLFFYIIATLMIILAAYDYLSSAGDETKVKAAKQRVIYAIAAIAIAVVAGGVVQLVKNFVG